MTTVKTSGDDESLKVTTVFLFLVTIHECDTRALAARLINHQITWWFFMSLPGGERPWERGWIMAGLWAELNLEKLIGFPSRLLFEIGRWVSYRKLSILRSTI